MSKFLLVYRNGSEMIEGVDVMTLWNNWVKEMGSTLVDEGTGVGKSKTVYSDKTIEDGGGLHSTFGTCIIQANNMDVAVKIAQGHPFLVFTRGNIEVSEIMRGA